MASSDQNLAHCKEEAHQARSNLEESQRKIENCLFQDKQKEDTIKNLEKQVKKLQMESVAAEEELASNRYPDGPQVGSRAEMGQ